VRSWGSVVALLRVSFRRESINLVMMETRRLRWSGCAFFAIQ
jgi:hypothetical protein